MKLLTQKIKREEEKLSKHPDQQNFWFVTEFKDVINLRFFY